MNTIKRGTETIQVLNSAFFAIYDKEREHFAWCIDLQITGSENFISFQELYFGVNRPGKLAKKKWNIHDDPEFFNDIFVEIASDENIWIEEIVIGKWDPEEYELEVILKGKSCPFEQDEEYLFEYTGKCLFNGIFFFETSEEEVDKVIKEKIKVSKSELDLEFDEENGEMTCILTGNL